MFYYFIIITLLLSSSITRTTTVQPFEGEESIRQNNRIGVLLDKYPLQYAIAKGDLEAFRSVLTFSNVNEKDRNGITPLVKALHIKDTNISIYFIKKLLDKGANPFPLDSTPKFMDEAFRLAESE